METNPALEIINAFGGVSKLAKALGHRNVTTVDGWKRSGRIPDWRKFEICQAAELAGIGLPPGFNLSEAA
jgi:hypothetical protein